MLAGVSAVGDTEAEVKVEALQQVIAEVVSLDHAEVVQGPVSDGEFNPSWRKTAKRETDLLCNYAVVLRWFSIVCVWLTEMVQKLF